MRVFIEVEKGGCRKSERVGGERLEKTIIGVGWVFAPRRLLSTSWLTNSAEEPSSRGSCRHLLPLVIVSFLFSPDRGGHCEPRCFHFRGSNGTENPGEGSRESNRFHPWPTSVCGGPRYERAICFCRFPWLAFGERENERKTATGKERERKRRGRGIQRPLERETASKEKEKGRKWGEGRGEGEERCN